MCQQQDHVSLSSSPKIIRVLYIKHCEWFVECVRGSTKVPTRALTSSQEKAGKTMREVNLFEPSCSNQILLLMCTCLCTMGTSREN